MGVRRALLLLTVTSVVSGLAVPASNAAVPDASPRAPAILGGSIAAPGAWPWVARIDLISPDGTFFPADGRPDETFWCGGSLIGERWVLTAGHCLILFEYVIGSPGFFVPGDFHFRVVIGETKLRSVANGENVYTVNGDDLVVLLPAAGSLSGDLALLRLDRPAPQPALRLVGAGQDPGPFTAPGTPLTAIGWGSMSEEGDVVDDLRQVDVPAVSDRDCAFFYPGATDFFGTFFAFDAHTMICAGSPGRDTCYGDSGSPLMARGPGGWVQVGITSWGEGCGRMERPGVYGRLPGLFGFILSSLKDNREAPAGAPRATTERAAGVTRRSARLIGTATPNGFATVYVIEFGTNRRYTGGRVEAYLGAGADTFTVSMLAGRLKPGTTYHFRVSAVNLAGIAEGIDRTFTTKPAKPPRGG